MTAGESVTRSGSVVSFSATYLNGRATRALGAGSVGKVHKAVGRYRIESMVFQFPGWLLKRSSRRSLGAHFSVIAEEIVKTFLSWRAGGSLAVSRTAIKLGEFPELKCFYTDVVGKPFVSRRG